MRLSLRGIMVQFSDRSRLGILDMKRQFNYLNMKWTQRLTNEANQWYLEISGDAIPKLILNSNQGLLYGFNPSLMKTPPYKGFSNDRFKKVKGFQKYLSKVLTPPASNNIRYERPLKFNSWSSFRDVTKIWALLTFGDILGKVFCYWYRIFPIAIFSAFCKTNFYLPALALILNPAIHTMRNFPHKLL